MAATNPGAKPGQGETEQSCQLIERALGSSAAFRKVDKCLYLVKQGSSYVMISVMSSLLNRKCLPMNVHGINLAAAFVLSHDSRTLRIPAASAAVWS